MALGDNIKSLREELKLTQQMGERHKMSGSYHGEEDCDGV